MEIILPKKANMLMSKLTSAGYQSYVVGGCVRDSFLGKKPQDWDIATDALPKEVMSLFSEYTVVPTGLSHGTVTVVVEAEHYEITTFRQDGDYDDGRHPRQVRYVSDIGTDLARRDFTINAMAYNEREGWKDPFDGRADIQKKRIRTVGDPIQRFGEDYLRILRGVRFSTVYRFQLEDKTKVAMAKLAPCLQQISGERIREELLKIVASPNAEDGIRLLLDRGLLRVLLPELADCVGLAQHNPHHREDVFNHTLSVLSELVDAKIEVKLAALFHDIGKTKTKTTDEQGIDHFYAHERESVDRTRDILRRLKFSNREVHHITTLIACHGIRPELKKTSLKRFINKVGVDLIHDLLTLQEADRKAHVRSEDDLDRLKKVRQQIEEILVSEEALTMKELALTGKDLIAMGYPPGPVIGQIKRFLLEHVLQYPQDNQKERLAEIVRKNHCF